MNGLQLILLGLSMLAAAFVLRRSLVLGRRSGRRDVQDEVRTELQARERAGGACLRDMELRLHKFGRETEGRLQTRVAVLDQLIDEADREIARLDELLARTEKANRPTRVAGPDVCVTLPFAPSAPNRFAAAQTAREQRSFTPRQSAMVQNLLDAGYTEAEVAHLLDCSTEDVRSAIDLDDSPPRAEAA